MLFYVKPIFYSHKKSICVHNFLCFSIGDIPPVISEHHDIESGKYYRMKTNGNKLYNYIQDYIDSGDFC